MDLKQVVGELGQLASCESAVAGFYAACAGAIPEDARFWKALSEQERAHASRLFDIAQAVNRSGGEGYRVQREFPGAALRTFVKGIEASAKDVMSGKLRGSRVYFVALETENALVESRFFEFLASSDPAFNTLLGQIAGEEREHRAGLEAKVRELRGKPEDRPRNP